MHPFLCTQSQLPEAEFCTQSIEFFELKTLPVVEDRNLANRAKREARKSVSPRKTSKGVASGFSGAGRAPPVEVGGALG